MIHTYRPVIASVCSVLVAALATPSQAQVPPDAGALRQQIEQGRELQAPRQVPIPSADDLTQPAAKKTGIQIEATSFRLIGNTLIDSAQLQNALAPFLNRPLDYNLLQKAVGVVIEQYQRAGWLVRAFLPEQDIVGGLVTIQVVEAKFGGTRVEELSPPRVDLAQIQAMIDSHQRVSDFLNTDALDRAVLLIDDLPGVTASGNLTEGAKPGETDLLLRLNGEPLVSGEAILDNFGSRSTGPTRLSVNLALNSPARAGDLLTANLIETEGSDYVRLGATVPLGSDGWRAGFNASGLRYKLLLTEFAPLDIKGSSDSIGLEASYPIVRTRLKNLYFSANYDSRNFDNKANGATSSHYQANDLTLGLWANAFDRFGGGGTNTASLAWTAGRLDLNGSPNQSADAASAHSEGNFHKLRYNISRLQTLNPDFSLYAALSGQAANKNLDSSEKFYLGGPNGVRAFPVNEAGGSSGHQISLELRQRLPHGFHMSAFYDYGQVDTNVDNNFASAPARNNSVLEGCGLSLGWQASSGLSLTTTWARRATNNPNPAAGGNDQDGSYLVDRWWFTASLPF